MLPLCLQIVDWRRSVSSAANASLHTLDLLFRHIGALYTTHKHTYSCSDQGILILILTQYEWKQIVTQSLRRTKYLHSALCVRIEASPKTKLIVGNSLTAPKWKIYAWEILRRQNYNIKLCSIRTKAQAN